MVANLTTGKKAYSAVEGDIQQLLSTTNALQEKLLDQVAADAEGFLPLAAVYALPKDAPDRAAKLVQASETACAVPLRIMELCVDAPLRGVWRTLAPVWRCPMPGAPPPFWAEHCGRRP